MKDSGRDGFVPLGYSYLKSVEIHQQVKEFGYFIVPFLDFDQLAELQKLYQENHSISQPGFFFSIFNNDLEYRKK